MRQVIVLVNLSNLTGFFNHTREHEKIRIDYSKFLDGLLDNRQLLKAIIVSQQDTGLNKSVSKLQSNQAFLRGLEKLGWEVLRVAFNSSVKDMTNVVNSIWSSVNECLFDAEGNQVYDPSNIDIVMVTGSASWYDVGVTLFNGGYNMEIAYPKRSTSKVLYANFAFWDISDIINASTTATVSAELI
jgi:hypothetical protein